jgi:membrane protein DedA with SNARE-associated domain
MHAVLDAIAQHGHLLLFAWVLVEQLGLPIPAMPVLLAAGVLAGLEKMSFGLAVTLAIIACLIGDLVWFWLGRRYGGGVVRVLCRVSLEPENCVRKTSDAFTKHGPVALLLAKFFPGICTVSIPLAGSSGIRFSTFLFYDLGGSALYVLTFAGIGLALSHSVQRLDDLTAHAHWPGLALLLLASAAVVVHRVWERRKFLHDLNMARIAPSELSELIQRGESPYIVDMRHPLDFLPHPKLIPGAIRIAPDEVVARSAEFPRDRDIILYCT